MSRKTALPGHLVGSAIRTSESTDDGVRRGRLRGSDVQHPFHGMSAIELDLDSVVGLCRAYEPVLREGQYFSHSTAAALYGVRLPSTLGTVPIHVTALHPDEQPRRQGVRGHVVTGGTLQMIHGLPSIAPADMWFQLAREVGFHDLIAAADYLISGVRQPGGPRTPPLCSRGDLQDAVQRFRGRRGARAATLAIPRARTGVDSRMETRMRLLLEDNGLRGLMVGHPVVVDGGADTLHPDLALPQLRLCFEYEGEEHRTDPRRFRDDIHRRERLEAAGWRVVRVTADDIFARPEEFLARVRQIIAQRHREL
ncbi:MAG: DUF559 domain-containing protein [Actinomycetota bacterium]